MTQPLVSVIMPSFNARDTLPRAAASLIAQTYESWECIFIDDGSADDSFQWMREITDSRFRCFRNTVNQGRGAARQLALDYARGKYLGMLDADDWYYPKKLQNEVDCIEADAAVVLVSADLAIIGRDRRLVGVRRNGRPYVPCARPNDVGVCFPPSLIRMEAAKQVGFDATIRVAEDREFLLRLLPGRAYACIPETLYAYNEYASATLEKVLQSNLSLQRQARRYSARSPVIQQALNCSYYAKSFLYRATFALGLQERMLRSRSSRPEPSDFEQFEAAWESVEGALIRCFGSEVPSVHYERSQSGE